MLSFERASFLLSYDPVAGVITWSNPTNTRIKKGRQAGSISSSGYMKLRLDGTDYYIHRIAWLLHYGDWPDGQIDHIDNVRTNNAISNLRQCNASQNQRNQGARVGNKSGVKGVCWDARAGKWKAQVCHAGRVLNGGNFTCLDDAERAVRKLRSSVHEEFTNHGTPLR